MVEPSPPEQYGIVVLGRTGLGKSTTANKLLGIRGGPAIWSRVPPEDANCNYFVTAGEGVQVDSVTKECQVLSNERNIRVVDTPGFADTERTKKVGVYKANLQIFRQILREQKKNELAFRRVLYFLPNRGPLERAEGTLQEEIRVMYEFFGEDIFNIMVIIATNPKMYQMYGFDEKYLHTSETVFTAAFKIVTGRSLKKCPPILYLPLAETNVLAKILAAEVIAEECHLKEPDVIRVIHTRQINELISNNPGRRLQFHDRCARCADKIVYEFDPVKKEKLPVRIVLWNEDEVPYDESKCHPIIVPKYSEITKIIGGLIHIITLGIVSGFQHYSGAKYVPWFTNSEEICPACKNSPGSDGCKVMGEEACVPMKGGEKAHVKTSHSTQLDKIEIDTL